MDALTDFYGRIFTKYQLELEQRQLAMTLPAMYEEKGSWYCQRCGSQIHQRTDCLPSGAYYCRACLKLGRVRQDEGLYHFPQASFTPQTAPLKWQGQLTKWQRAISECLCQTVSQQKDCLVHAVTGAGKTEMIYQLIAMYLSAGKAICLASPRVDVCLELHQRLSKDFTCPIALLHGEGAPYFRTPLVIATTHQLLKFHRAFDLLIIDEVDAFPYVDNATLYHAVSQALKADGRKVFLTATSTDELDRQIKKGNLQLLKLPRRFHEQPLVVPQKIWMGQFYQALQKEKLPRKLKIDIEKQRASGYPLLIFVPEISTGKELKVCLQKYFPNAKIDCVSSQSENRLGLVQDFRDGTLEILISTTILERGVTFPCVDVMVIDASHRLFSKSSLVQISGRVGRSQLRPTGLLAFYHQGTTRAIEKAIVEIKMMNQEAKDGSVSTVPTDDGV